MGDWVETVVKVHCGTVLGDNFDATMKMRPPKRSHNALDHVAIFSLGVNSLSFKYQRGIYYLKIALSSRNKFTWILSVVAFSSEIRKINIQKFSGFESILYHYLFHHGVITLF